MTGRPALQAKSSQKVLHYMLSQPELIVKAWRSRIYFYSSGSFLKIAGEALIDWVNETPHLHRLRADCLQKLTDEDDMYEILGDAIIHFMKMKPLPFPHALLSKRHFWEIKGWKRAMIFVFLLRVVLQLKAPKQWKKYNVKDYKFNIRSFRYVINMRKHTPNPFTDCLFYRLYLRMDRAIIERSTLYKEMDDDVATPVKRKRKVVDTASPSTSEPPVQMFCVLTDSDEENE